jgi:hypothetical protein
MAEGDKAKQEGGMPLDKAVGFVIDYTKFIQVLWGAYVTFTAAILGALISLVGKTPPLDAASRHTLTLGYLVASLIFVAVLIQNHRRLIRMMLLVDALAANEDKKAGCTLYTDTFRSGHGPGFLRHSIWLVVVVAGLMTWFISNVAR